MNTIKERRKYQRFNALDNILAIDTMRFGQVINLSMGGLRIKYLLRHNDPLQHSLTISLLNNAGDHYIDGLTCKVVSTTDSDPISPSINLFILEAGVVFTNLTSSQKYQLADFVLLNTLVDA